LILVAFIVVLLWSFNIFTALEVSKAFWFCDDE